MKKILAALALLCAASPAFAGTAVPKWDVVPYQRVAGVFRLGVVAFHPKGVTLEFSINGKRKYLAKSPTLNERTKVWEYVWPLDTSKYPDGPLAIGAKVMVEGEKDLILPELTLYGNNQGKLGSDRVVWIDPENGNDFSEGTETKPVKSFKAALMAAGDGGTIYLLPGVYTGKRMGGKTDSALYWTTVQPAPGAKRSDVKIEGGRLGADKIRFKGVEFFMSVADGYAALVSGEGGNTIAWFDGCRMYNRRGRGAVETRPFGNKLIAYVTGGVTSDIGSGPSGALIRGHLVKKISRAAFGGDDCLVVNSRVVDVNPADDDLSRANFFQSTPSSGDWCHDVFFYNVSGFELRCQGLFGTRLRDSAFVNLCLERVRDCPSITQFSGPMENVSFAHLTMVNQPWDWHVVERGALGNFEPKDVFFANGVLDSMTGFAVWNGTCGLTVRNNVICGVDWRGDKVPVYGDNATYLERNFANEADRNYAFVNCPLQGEELACVPADINGKPYAPGPRTCGAFAP